MQNYEARECVVATPSSGVGTEEVVRDVPHSPGVT